MSSYPCINRICQQLNAKICQQLYAKFRNIFVNRERGDPNTKKTKS